MTLRSLAEKISRGITFRRTLKTKQGTRSLWVAPEASLKYWLPRSLNSELDLKTFTDIFIKPGDVIWDLGGNVGAFTFLASAASGSKGVVYTFEPDPFLGNLLLKTIRSSPPTDASVTLVPLAVSDVLGYRKFVIPERSRASNHLSGNDQCTQAGSERHSQQVLTVTLDWMLTHTPPPAIIKMDIEGEEFRALKGADQLLIKYQPILLMEIWETISVDTTAFLKSHGYQLFDASRLPEYVKVERTTWSTLALPASYIWNSPHSYE